MTAAQVTLDGLRGRATCTVEEAADLLGVSRGVGYEAARTGAFSRCFG